MKRKPAAGQFGQARREVFAAIVSELQCSRNSSSITKPNRNVAPRTPRAE